MIVTGIEAQNQRVLHGHCHQCLHRIKTERNPWRLVQLLDHELAHRQRRRLINGLLRRLDYWRPS
ncbi:hypothetical protein [Endozoicomonas sp. SCSIO W0465]|uniref:hypothetical protein n=1 Tax=Endozoicomonas sp. SCSIO W0465 TaxID=2918516 RepID=UPI0020759E0A|nr:hypothetical protein [Endozoicomonas sp. SCSIO W0465]USE39259.1 hypothetical protein MJO57_14500 [Endozoicomonas sp. SCSIO W0465]